MSTNPLNDISKVYLDQIAEKKKDDSYLETDMKKRQANNEKARKELAKGPQMKNPHFEETQMEGVRDTDPEKGTAERKARLEKKRGMKLDDHPQYAKEALDPVGKEDGDIDNDGDKDSSDKYLMKRRKAIGKAMKKRLKEERESLSEVMDDTEASKTVKEKKVNNKVTINPKLGEAVEEMGGTLIEHIEIDEMDFIIESVYDELIEEGYSEDDVEAAIENAMEATVTFGHDTKDMKKDGSPVGSKRRFLKRKAKAFLGNMAAKAYNKGREVYQSKVEPKLQRAKTSAKRGIKKAAQKVVDKMSEEAVEETYTVTAADKKANTKAYQNYKAGMKKKDGTPMYKAADHMGEEASMSPQELMLQKKKARIDRMIAMKRAQELSKTKAGGDTPAKAMGEGKELSIDQQMKISQEYNRKSPEERKAMVKKALAGIKKGTPKKDTRTDAQKMTDATGPRPGSRYRGD